MDAAQFNQLATSQITGFSKHDPVSMSGPELAARLKEQPLTEAGTAFEYSVLALVQATTQSSVILISPVTNNTLPCTNAWIPVAVSAIRQCLLGGSQVCVNGVSFPVALLLISQ